MLGRLTCGVVPALVTAFALSGCDDVSAPAGTDPQADLGNLPSLQCDGLVGGGSVGNVEVRKGGSCTLTDVTVRGNVKVLEGATLELVGGTVLGNVQGDKPFAVEVRGTRVEGNVQVQESQFAIVIDATVGGDIQIQKTSNSGVVLVTGSDVLTGNIQIEENNVLTLDVSGNDVVKGNLQVFKNRGGGDKLVSGNRVAQNLQCGENSSPFTAGGNIAGDREGQCQ